MLLQSYVEMNITRRNIRYYKERGYDCNCGDIIKVHIIDLPRYSRAIVKVECDYCGSYIEKQAQDYFESKETLTNKDCCKECKYKKNQDECFLKYGVSSHMKRKEVVSKCVSSLCKYDWQYVCDLFCDNNYTLVSKKEDFNNIKINNKIKYICNIHPDKGVLEVDISHLHQGRGCKYCGYEKIGIKQRKYTESSRTLQMYLRDRLRSWKKETLKLYDYKCDILKTNKNIQIHHLYSFNLIYDELISTFGIIVKDIKKYTKEELVYIEKKFVELHEHYGFGVVLEKEIHLKFHSIYKNGNNTPEQYEEFKINYLNGNLDKLIS